MSIYEALGLQAFVASLVLIVVGILLYRRGLLRWTRTGFWVCVGYGLYFAVSPVLNLVSQDSNAYDLPLELSGGVPRALWILLVSTLGIVAFFFVYLRTHEPVVRWRLSNLEENREITRPMWVIIALCCMLGLYSLVKYRSGWITNSDIAVQNGRFVGSVTGYQYTAHLLLFVPAVLLMLSKNWRWRLTGFSLGLMYAFVSSLDPWGRYLVVSMILAISLADAANRGPRWRRITFVCLAALTGIILQTRGHAQFRSGSQAIDLVQQIPTAAPSALGGGDAGMLGGWYLQSYVNDTLVGYDYGIPLVNYAILGPLPNHFFPDKYFMVDWLHGRQPVVDNPYIVLRLNGAKTSLMGGFYKHGGIYAVVILMLFTGFLARKLDGMLQEDGPMLVRATGIAFLSTIWMDFGSDDYWILMEFGMFAIPAIGIWIASKKIQRSHGVERIQGEHGKRVAYGSS